MPEQATSSGSASRCRPADGATLVAAAKRFSADCSPGGSVRPPVDGGECSSVHVELSGVRIAPPSANFQRTGLMRRRRRVGAAPRVTAMMRSMGVRWSMGLRDEICLGARGGAGNQ
jgi:hypothetical protein